VGYNFVTDIIGLSSFV